MQCWIHFQWATGENPAYKEPREVVAAEPSLCDVRTCRSSYNEKMANAALSSSVAASAPTASPPPGLPPPTQEDFVYSPTQAKATVAFGAIVTTLTLVSVIARLYTHKFVIRRVRVDDVWAVIAMVRQLDCARVVRLYSHVFPGGRACGQYLAEYLCVEIPAQHDVDQRRRRGRKGICPSSC